MKIPSWHIGLQPGPCRANMKDDIGKESRTLTVYRFGALPPNAGFPE